MLPILADEMKFQFKNPRFSGNGYSSHVLTVENQEFTRREALAAEIKAMQEALDRDWETSFRQRE